MRWLREVKMRSWNACGFIPAFQRDRRAGAAVAVLRAAVMTAFVAVPLTALAQDAVEAPVIGTAALPRDLSPWGMFLNADPLVKGVLIGLAVASVVTWTVWLAKTAKRRVGSALRILARVRSTTEGLERLAGSLGEVREFLDAAATELRLSADSLDPDGIKERVASRLERIEAARARRMLRGTSVLATSDL
jgi:biopolymer transport protein ExbB